MSNDDAPHGLDDSGNPLAPYGYLVNGKPRKSNRGARPGQQGNANTTRAKSKPAAASRAGGNRTDARRKAMLSDLADMFLISPLASASTAAPVVKKLGARQADALAGDAFILSHFVPGMADGLILMAQSKPKMLSWLDKVEENAPYMVFASALISAGKAIAENHFRPSPNMAQAGRSLARLKMEAMADAVNAQAAGMQAESEQMSQYATEDAAYDTQQFAAVG